MFSKSNIFSGLLLASAVLGFSAWAKGQPNRVPAPPKAAAIRFEPAATSNWRISGARLTGAWRLTSDEPRFGGASALAIDGGEFLALTDSGVAIRFGPPRGGSATSKGQFAELGDGPCDPRWKSCRDSEALARAPGGGWYVAFENYHSLWRFDPALRGGIEVASLEDEGFVPNRGIEGLIGLASGRLLAFPEDGVEMLTANPATGRVTRGAVRGLGPGVSDAVVLPDGRVLLVRRRFGLTGFTTELLALGRDRQGWAVARVARLSLGWLDNVEGAAATPLPDGETRLWLVTDNDFRAGWATLLLAIDLPPAPGRQMKG
ncbi:MAG: esterase-like activity of phytase family protein [Sphingomicrobium sp.]